MTNINAGSVVFEHVTKRFAGFSLAGSVTDGGTWHAGYAAGPLWLRQDHHAALAGGWNIPPPGAF
ncbi:hypothetical protein LZ023_40480 (plasmid) [Pseudomonas silvicola]|nr:hypothetical protein LZ023_40480 [Pseudomonas silvicola]